MKVDLYWCVNCSHRSKAKRIDQGTCDHCNYYGITTYALAELREDEDLAEKFKDCIDENPIITGS